MTLQPCFTSTMKNTSAYGKSCLKVGGKTQTHSRTIAPARIPRVVLWDEVLLASRAGGRRRRAFRVVQESRRQHRSGVVNHPTIIAFAFTRQLVLVAHVGATGLLIFCHVFAASPFSFSFSSPSRRRHRRGKASHPQALDLKHDVLHDHPRLSRSREWRERARDRRGDKPSRPSCYRDDFLSC